ncbi:hypothetical protein BDB01DRAFT_832702 [Pilobolus umbonatus]|nr:hypothetical protein BDB01DRAFT_832702 [Pilobolus umbonatus]
MILYNVSVKLTALPASTRRPRKVDSKRHPARTLVESSNEDSSDSSSITRCVCGEGHNVGLMVQCDMCEVWQHCQCIGLKEARIPDHYYCEQCQPKNHQFVITANGRSKRLYNATQNYMNDSPESISLNHQLISESNSDTLTNSDNDIIKRPYKRRRKGEAGNNQDVNMSECSVKSKGIQHESIIESVGIVAYDATLLLDTLHKQIDTVENEEENTVEERITRSRRTTKTADITIRENSQDIEEATPSRRKKPAPNNINNNKRFVSSSSFTGDKKPLKHNKTSTSSHTSMEESSSSNISISTPYWNYQDGLPTRENSPPAKIKYPTPKMSFSDMNKRAKQIMECINRIENSDLMNKKSSGAHHPPTTMTATLPTPPIVEIKLEDMTDMASPTRPRSMSTSSGSSESSASTIPLLDDLLVTKEYHHLSNIINSSPSTPIPIIHKITEEETSIEILDRVTRELLKFQRKFGMYQPHYARGHPGTSFTSKVQGISPIQADK